MKNMSSKKTDWWKISGYWFLFLAIVNIFYIFFILASPIISGNGSLNNLANPFGVVLVIIGLVELGIFLSIPYLYFKKSNRAITMTIIIYVIFEGGLKLLSGVYGGNTIDYTKIGAASLSILSSLYLIYKIKQTQPPSPTKTKY